MPNAVELHAVDEPKTEAEFREFAELEYVNLVERVALLLLSMEGLTQADIYNLSANFGANVIRVAHDYKNATVH